MYSLVAIAVKFRPKMAKKSQTEEKQGVERRKNERISTRIEVHFKAPPDAARALRAYSLNFSIGGLCIKTGRQYEVGEKLALNLKVAGQEFNIEAAVSWLRPGAVGVRFIDVPVKDRARLEELMSTLRPGKY
jgi:uncharacterized protein (TIGR02266 family)